MTTATFTKLFADSDRCAAAAHHHAWIAACASPLRQPSLYQARPTSLTFERIVGRDGRPDDLPMLAAILGDAHGVAWRSDLHKAHLDRPHRTPSGELRDFVTCREAALRKRRTQGHLANDASLLGMLGLLRRSAAGPAAFYKDANPRNVVITEDGTVYWVDTDDLTLAPFGYDLAKLVVTLTMTYGAVGEAAIRRALSAYNQAAARHAPHLGRTSRARFDDFITLHTILTAPYAGRGPYRWSAPGPSGLTPKATL